MRGKSFFISVIIYLSMVGTACAEVTTDRPVNDEQIKHAIIQDSISSYPGNCPCPYNTARNGSRCGGRSAYSRAGGYSPLCYARDVTQEMVATYKQAHNLQ
jgi:hypothetical protein